MPNNVISKKTIPITDNDRLLSNRLMIFSVLKLYCELISLINIIMVCSELRNQFEKCDISNETKKLLDSHKKIISLLISLCTAFYGRTINDKNYFGKSASILPLVAVVTHGFIKPRLIGEVVNKHIEKNGYDQTAIKNQLNDKHQVEIKNWQTVMVLAFSIVLFYPINPEFLIGALKKY